jgi:hypothetical protein
MKKALLIVTGLMALGLPVHAAQIAQANQVELNQQVKPIQTETNLKCHNWPCGEGNGGRN